MKHPQQAEAHVLDRMMHLLEEGSVRHLAASDETFGDFVQEVYRTLSDRAQAIRHAQPTAETAIS